MDVDADYLFEAVQSVAGGKGSDRLVDIVRGTKNSVVFLKICRGDDGVGIIQVIQDGAGGGEAVSNVLVSEGADENLVNSREKNFSESLVGDIVLVEECGCGVKLIAKFSDLGASGVGWDDGYIAGVDSHDEGDGQQSVVDGG